MINVCTVEAMRAMDAHMINSVGIPGVVLMENAASALLSAVKRVAKPNSVVGILCGIGNNGGDGLALLRQLSMYGIKAFAVLVFGDKAYSDDALLNYNAAVTAGLDMTDDIARIGSADIIVDALFGTGLSRDIEGTAKYAIELANAQTAYRIAADIPSGMNGNSGAIMGCVFMADETITFHAVKRGLLLTKNREAVGKLTVASIGVMTPEMTVKADREVLADGSLVENLIPKRKIVSNKGDHGRATLFVGSDGMFGAAVMSAKACLRAGAGLTKVLIPESILTAFSSVPEVMAVTDENQIDQLIEWANALCVGCGLGVGKRTRMIVERALLSGKKLVIDADGLNQIAIDRELLQLLHRNVIVTPHPAEMARLLGCSADEVLSSFVESAKSFAHEYGCTVLLKSAVSVIVDSEGLLRYNTEGNSGLAKGGSGDVLAGIVTSMMAQGLEPFDAATVGAYLLGTSANIAFTALGNRALLASDVIDAL